MCLQSVDHVACPICPVAATGEWVVGEVALGIACHGVGWRGRSCSVGAGVLGGRGRGCMAAMGAMVLYGVVMIDVMMDDLQQESLQPLNLVSKRFVPSRWEGRRVALGRSSSIKNVKM